jgi:hypothetical protein
MIGSCREAPLPIVGVARDHGDDGLFSSSWLIEAVLQKIVANTHSISKLSPRDPVLEML